LFINQYGWDGKDVRHLGEIRSVYRMFATDIIERDNIKGKEVYWRITVKCNFESISRRGGAEVWLYSFFNVGARWKWVTKAPPRPGRLTPEKETRYLFCRAVLDGCEECCWHMDSIAGPSSP
jgi:hypothetical protein